VPIVEAMAALVLCDHALRQRAIDFQARDQRPQTMSTKGTKA
jgi:chorismate synthase